MESSAERSKNTNWKNSTKWINWTNTDTHVRTRHNCKPTINFIILHDSDWDSDLGNVNLGGAVRLETESDLHDDDVADGSLDRHALGDIGAMGNASPDGGSRRSFMCLGTAACTRSAST